MLSSQLPAVVTSHRTSAWAHTRKSSWWEPTQMEPPVMPGELVCLLLLQENRDWMSYEQRFTELRFRAWKSNQHGAGTWLPPW